MLSHAATDMGYGWGLGVHEALDQFGALFGPLLVALVLAASQRDSVRSSSACCSTTCRSPATPSRASCLAFSISANTHCI